MTLYKNKYRIESHRWEYWDYSTPADYFITIVTQNRSHIFGKIKNGKIQLSKYGEIVEAEFLKIKDYHKRAVVDEYIIMPNHVHCIIRLTDYTDDSQPIEIPPIHTKEDIKQYRKRRRNMVLMKILGKFKQQTSKQINILRDSPGTKNWQGSFHDHVIRNDRAYHNIKNYIINNPIKWDEDKFCNTDNS